MNVIWRRPQDWGLPLKAAILAFSVVALLAGVMPLANRWAGPLGAMAMALAASVCLAGAVAALIIAHRVGKPRDMLRAALLGMGARVAPPLVAALVCWRWGQPLVDAGVLYGLLLFYPVTLVLETWLSLPAMQRTDG